MLRDGLFEASFVLEAVEIPPHGSGRPVHAVGEITDDGLPGAEVSLDSDVVPTARPPDVTDSDAVLLGPEEWDRMKGLAVAEHVGGRHLALTLGNSPMLDPDRLARQRIRKGRDVASRIDARNGRLEELIDDDSVRDTKSGWAREVQARPDADADQDIIGPETCSIGDRKMLAVVGGSRAAEMKPHAIPLVKIFQEAADLRAQCPFEGNMLDGNHVHLDASGAKSGRSLEADEAGADDDSVSAAADTLDQPARIVKRSKHQDVPMMETVAVQTSWLGSGREQQAVIR